MQRKKPVILIVDDRDGRPTARRLGNSVVAIVRHPQEVSDADLRMAQLVLMDWKLEVWPERSRQETPSLKPQNGVALISVLRSNVEMLKAHPTAFALNTGLLSQLGGGVSDREHAVARSLDLEWAFQKGDQDNEAFGASVCSLASAVSALPREWSSLKTKELLFKLLDVPKRSTWRHAAIDSIDRAYPPHEILLENSSGLAFLRWLLHAVLPYPAFLLDSRYLAARLRLEPAWFIDHLSSRAGGRIRRLLAPFEYGGVLSQFDGPRWWRAGVESFLWKQTKGRPFDAELLAAFAKSKISRNAERTLLKNPVISLNDALSPSNTLIELGQAVELRPDGWPPYAERAWIARDKATLSAFIALVPQSEKDRLF